MMKYNSTLNAPNGKIPPIAVVKIGCMYQAWAGICLGIKLVRTGCVTTSLLYPKKEPKKTRGTDTQNHKKSNVKKVGNAMVPDDPSYSNTMFKPKNTVKITLGYKKAVKIVFCFHSVPLNILYVTELL